MIRKRKTRSLMRPGRSEERPLSEEEDYSGDVINVKHESEGRQVLLEHKHDRDDRRCFGSIGREVAAGRRSSQRDAASRAIRTVINSARITRSWSGRVGHARRPFAAASVGITASAIWANGSAHERVSRAPPSPPSSAFTRARVSRHFAAALIVIARAKNARGKRVEKTVGEVGKKRNITDVISGGLRNCV